MNLKRKLEEFHRKFFHKTGDYRVDTNQKFLPGNPTAIRMAELIKEEALELVEALRTGTLSDVRKEVCDLVYVAFGPVAVYNLPFEEDFEKVHKNNLLKFDTGYLDTNGKWRKATNHPKVEFPDITELQYELTDYRKQYEYKQHPLTNETLIVDTFTGRIVDKE